MVGQSLSSRFIERTQQDNVMPGIGIITNPHSRRNRRFPEQMRRLGYILGQHDQYEMTNRIEEVEDVAEQFLENDIDILALNGGDGTNHVTLTRFIEAYGDHPLPKIALLRGGTMNTVSESVGISGTPSRLLANLVEKYYTNQPFETTARDMLKITDEHGSNYGFIFGNGVISNFLEMYYDTGRPSPSVAAALVTRGVGEMLLGGGPTLEKIFRPFRAQMIFETGESWPDVDYQTIMASTVDQIGLGFRPFIRCEEQEGAFHILGVIADAIAVGKALPRIRMGLPLDETLFKSAVTNKVTFQSNEPITYTIDGDMHTSNDGLVVLEAGPRVEIIIK